MVSAALSEVGGYAIIRRSDDAPREAYLAKSAQGSLVVLALLDLEPGDRRQVAAEVERCRHLDHPAVGRVIESFEHEGRLAVVLEHHAGVTLTSLLTHLQSEGERLADGAALYIAKAVLDALAAAQRVAPTLDHKSRLVHHQLGPDQVLVTWAAAVKVYGLGLSAAYRAAWALHPLDATQLAFVAPELRDGGEPKALSNTFSAAALLWSLLTQQLPSESGSPLPSLAKLRGDLDRDLVGAIERAGSARASDRFLGGRQLERVVAGRVTDNDREELGWNMEVLRALLVGDDLACAAALPPSYLTPNSAERARLAAEEATPPAPVVAEVAPPTSGSPPEAMLSGPPSVPSAPGAVPSRPASAPSGPALVPSGPGSWPSRSGSSASGADPAPSSAPFEGIDEPLEWSEQESTRQWAQSSDGSIEDIITRGQAQAAAPSETPPLVAGGVDASAPGSDAPRGDVAAAAQAPATRPAVRSDAVSAIVEPPGGGPSVGVIADRPVGRHALSVGGVSLRAALVAMTLTAAAAFGAGVVVGRRSVGPKVAVPAASVGARTGGERRHVGGGPGAADGSARASSSGVAGANEASAARGSASAITSAAPRASASPSADPAALPATIGYLIVQPARSGVAVYDSGHLLGLTGERLQVPCGVRFLRLGTDPLGKWLGAGRGVPVACQRLTVVELDARL